MIIYAPFLPVLCLQLGPHLNIGIAVSTRYCWFISTDPHRDAEIGNLLATIALIASILAGLATGVQYWQKRRCRAEDHEVRLVNLGRQTETL